MNAYKFSASASNECPTYQVLDKAFSDEALTRAEKDEIADKLWGIFGANSSTFRSAGWAWDMRSAKQIKKILVRDQYDHRKYTAYYAPDKTSLRKALGTTEDMIYI